MSSLIDFKYNMIYSCNRRTISIRINDDNSITVRCPTGTSLQTVEKFLCKNQSWIRRKIHANIAIINDFKDVIAMKKILVAGNLYDLKICACNKIEEDVVYIKSISSLKSLYVKMFGRAFMSRFKDLANRNCFNYNEVSFKSYKGRWGCCDEKNNIVFNYKLLMLSEDLQIAVIAHELCHTVHHNHSAAFHRLLDHVCPCNREYGKLLKHYAFVARLY